MALPTAPKPTPAPELQRSLPLEAPTGAISGLPLPFATTRGKVVGKGRYGSVESYPPDRRLTGSDSEQLAVKYSLDARTGSTTTIAPDAIRELRYLGGLRHPNVLRLVDYFAYPGALGIVTPLASGSIAHLASRLDAQQVRTLVRQLLLALDYVHANGVVHADVKPDNVLLYANERGVLARSVLADFGLAHDDRCRDRGNLLADRGFTAAYRAPECNLGAMSTPPSDVWAAVVLTYNVATRHRLIRLEGLTDASPPSEHALASWRAQVKLLGKPSERTWPGVTRLPHWATMTRGLRSPPVAPGAWQTPEVVEPALRAFVSRALIMDPLRRATAAQLSSDPWFGAEAFNAGTTEHAGCHELLAESLRAPSPPPVADQQDLEQHRQAIEALQRLVDTAAASRRTRHCAAAVLDRASVPAAVAGSSLRSWRLGGAAFAIAASMLEPRPPSAHESWLNPATLRSLVLGVPAATLGETTAYDELYSLQDRYSARTQETAASALSLMTYTSCGRRFGALTRARLALVLGCLATGERCLERERGASSEELEPCLIAMFEDLRALRSVHLKTEFHSLLGALGKVPLSLS
jgi:cyclin-dependent kinase 2